ncbi:hypothetical protein [Mycolicibacterium sediminis]|uniref:Alanine and proline rich membrane protein n=1 Tax=Mycolicibacterium sediminis TaxID=1286180 RepID=A0A7I7QY90_9MYCO|nr:hypothetical protein [Mycolicibacterium sediminis]BBY31314.1 hypothetical protein MSEDJ_54100 [Mycolicibacterium sediminis]
MSDRATPPADAPGPSRRLPLIALVVAVIGLALAVWATQSSGPPEPSGEVAKDSAARSCTAFDTVSAAVQLRTNADLGPGPIANAAVAANARLSLLGGGIYLLNSLEPTTPHQLASYLRTMARDLQDFGINSLAGADYSAGSQATLMANIEQTRKEIANLCRDARP